MTIFTVLVCTVVWILLAGQARTLTTKMGVKASIGGRVLSLTIGPPLLVLGTTFVLVVIFMDKFLGGTIQKHLDNKLAEYMAELSEISLQNAREIDKMADETLEEVFKGTNLNYKKDTE